MKCKTGYLEVEEQVQPDLNEASSIPTEGSNDAGPGRARGKPRSRVRPGRPVHREASVQIDTIFHERAVYIASYDWFTHVYCTTSTPSPASPLSSTFDQNASLASYSSCWVARSSRTDGRQRVSEYVFSA